MDLAAKLVGSTDATLTLKDKAAGVSFGDDSQIFPMTDSFQVTFSRTHAPAVSDRRLGAHHALLIGAVVIWITGVTGGFGGIQDGIIERVLIVDLAYPLGAFIAAQTVTTLLVVLHTPENRPNVGPAPASVPQLAPGVVVEMLAAHPNLAVDG